MMGSMDRAALVQQNVVVTNRIDQLSEVVDGHGGTLTAHKAELNRLDGLTKVLSGRNTDLQSQLIDVQDRLDEVRAHLLKPWYKRVFTSLHRR